MEELRSKNGYSTYTYDFLKFDVLVTCPKCNQKAIINTSAFNFLVRDDSMIKVICTNCGFNKRLIETPKSTMYSNNNKKTTGRFYFFNAKVDPFFHLSLWLQKSYSGKIIWAYNSEHLEFLINHIKGKLRERNGKNRANTSLASRLPRWMTSRKHRELIVKEFSSLKRKVI